MCTDICIIFLPSVIFSLYLLLSIAPVIDPKLESYGKFRYVFEALLFGLGIPVSIGKITRLAIGLVLVFTGNYMGKIRHNYTFGIKTPWTLASE